MTVAFGPYFAIVGARSLPSEPLPSLRQLGLFAVAAIVQMLILGIGRLYFRRGSPQDAHVPPDERDLAIIRRSVSSAYYVLIVGMILVGCVMPFNSSGWSIINAAVVMIVAAEVVHYGVVVFSYRRQA
jgi:cytochrome b561